MAKAKTETTSPGRLSVGMAAIRPHFTDAAFARLERNLRSLNAAIGGTVKTSAVLIRHAADQINADLFAAHRGLRLILGRRGFYVAMVGA